RDDMALHAAKLAAAEIAAKSTELATTRGIDSVQLGIGIAQWQFEGSDYCAPVLLRPLAIRRYGNDFELRLRGEATLNPALARAMEEQFQIVLDAQGFIALAQQDGAFKPNPVIDRLRGLTQHLEWFNVQPRLVVSSFADVATALVADAADLDHPILDALAGNPNAKWAVEESFVAAETQHPDARSPETDTLLLDADAEQEDVVAQIAAGNSVAVKTLPGTGGTQTIVNAIGCLLQQNKRVLVVSPRRSSLQGIVQRFGDIGLGGLPVAPATLQRDVIRAIGRNEKAQQPQLGEVDEALVRLRKILLDYRSAVTQVDPVLGVSVLDCLTELSRLALLPEPPTTTARLSRAAVERLLNGRAQAAETMIQAASLGEFQYGPGDSAWYGASFTSSEQASRAHGIAKQLYHVEVPRLLQRANELLAGTRMRPFESIAELGVYLRLLTEIRDTLDKFLPVVFERSLSDLIAATSSRKDSDHMSAANRRRMRRLAREYQRPGSHVSDMNEALRRIQQQRFLWQRFVAEGVIPEIPVGIADVQVAHQQVVQDLSALDEPLGNHTTATQLANLRLDELAAKLAGLSAESDALQNLQERTALVASLRELDIEPLLFDLSARHVSESAVTAELELAWWRSALDSLLEQDRALLGANTEVLDRLEADFRMVDEAHASGSAHLLAWQLAENWSVGLVDWPDEAAELKKLLRGRAVDSRALQEAAPHLSRFIAPVWVASPYEVPEITDSMRFDSVILVDAGAMTVAETLGAIRRGKQVVAFGDPVTQTPSPFTIAIGGSWDDDGPGGESAEDLDELHASSALSSLANLLPTLTLTRSYRAGGED
ncbi:MAG: AAA family ATPase, partial [Salinibacterium sp.]|nr:AAA family ATPase [Salinibacterium sp.]